MYKIGITGTLQGLNDLQDAALVVYMSAPSLSTLIGNQKVEIHHGMAEGVDEVLGNIFKLNGFTVIGHPGLTYNGKVYKRGKCQVTEERSPGPFLDRNRDIVRETDELWAFPKERNTRRADGTWTPIRSGTWATIRFAERENKKVVIFWPDGDIEVVNENK